MKKRTRCLKSAVAVLSVILVVLIGIAGTLAYLKAETTPVINTFSPSNIGLTLEETATPGGTATTNTYKMVPGVAISKDPKVTVTADIDCYVFVKVEEFANFDTYMTYAIASGWTELTTNSGVYYREVSVAADEDNDGKKDVEAFYVLAGDSTYPNGVVTVDAGVTKTQMDALYNADGTVNANGQPKLTFTAYAIQKAGFESNIAGAWDEAQGQQNAG